MNPQVSSLWLFMFTLSEETFKLTSSRLCRRSSELSAHSSCLMLPQMSETAQAAPAPACCPHVGGGVLRYRGHWVGVMCNGDLWRLGTRKWAPCGAITTMLWSERELGTCRAENYRVTKCERAQLYSALRVSLMCCVPLVISWRSDQWRRRDGTGHNELIVLGCINGSYHRHLPTLR